MSIRIRLQADDFLLAYKVLEKNYESATLAIMTPSIVCLAFSVELYIKDLHFVLKGKAPRGHDILKLFKQLPAQTKQEIFDYPLISQNPFTVRGDALSAKRYSRAYTAYDGFIDHIEAISKGFEEWRYPFEKRASHRYNSEFAEDFINAIKSVSDSIRGNQYVSALKLKS